MERSTWTDDRIDERMAAIDITFGRIDKNMDVLRDEMRGLRQDMSVEMRGLREEMSALQRQVAQIGWGVTGSLIAAMVALIIALG